MESGEFLLFLGESCTIAVNDMLLGRVAWVLLRQDKPESSTTEVSVEDCPPLSIKGFQAQGGLQHFFYLIEV